MEQDRGSTPGVTPGHQRLNDLDCLARCTSANSLRLSLQLWLIIVHSRSPGRPICQWEGGLVLSRFEGPHNVTSLATCVIGISPKHVASLLFFSGSALTDVNLTEWLCIHKHYTIALAAFYQ